ncbi:1-acyl-sn-glycerol-3-phosphate acyltransferases [Flexibacter flexilis DSM 6793]|uniref:1-acyl-sn-glycerol-3-phosphate acyltransferases n=1 Tax=Flexibacter flexilis DSM 6793 TaxID=927664 RepID=A0A1I1JWX2_9BACT|nr:lysophospholipid acyltransferase family protein [Flexibacter flexilis]SFC53006.1 1-acyl-sn-glycerol-3-phosphate acyltransferases [Flexibacter flexilis DSM 6793]
MMKLIARFYFWLTGWKTGQRVPKDLKKMVLIAAPHTSNWDLPIALSALYIMDVRVNFLIKKEWLKPPMGWLIKALGGIGVDRSKRTNMVEAMVQTFKEAERMIMIIPPEGTRGYVKEWKSGFYHVAQQAGVPVIMGYLDYKKKVAGVSDPFYTTGNYEADLKQIQDFYRGITPKYPELSSLYEPTEAVQK